MSFISFQFLLFAAIIVLLYYVIPKRFQWVFLLAASYTFYLFGGIDPLIFIISTTLTTFGAGIWMSRVADKNKDEKRSAIKKRQKPILVSLILFNFGILFILKYYNFFVIETNSIFKIFEYNSDLPLVNIMLPLGISFYTFQAMGYAIDIYRGKCRAEENLARFALFISFFPQIIQGPISRFTPLSEQLFTEHKFDYIQVKFGAQLMLWGFFKKMVIADRAAVVVNQVFPIYLAYDGTQIFIAIVVYAIQIYADFSGGIDIARGIAQMMGIDLPQNFRRPYFATSILDYWRRWHMTLTAWMTDYVFFTLTLSRTAARLGKWARRHLKGNMAKQLPLYMSTFVVFFTIGVWHGTGWGYIVFGLYNGIMIVSGMMLEPVFTFMKSKLHINEKSFAWKVFSILRTFFVVLIGKCITEASSVGDAFVMLFKCREMFHFEDFGARMLEMGLDIGNIVVLIVSCLVLLSVSLMQENGIEVRKALSQRRTFVRWAIYLLAIGVVLIFGIYGPGYSVEEFIYRNY